MQPKKGVTTRKKFMHVGSTSEPTPDISQMIAEQIVASMPNIISQISASIRQSFDGQTPGGSGPRVEPGPRVGTGSGSGATVVLDDPPKGCSHKTFMGCKPPEFRGTEGAVGTLQWLEKMISIFDVIGCSAEDRVKFATFMFQGSALTWWNTVIGARGRTSAGLMTWEQFRTLMIGQYVPDAELERLEAELGSLQMQGSDILGYTDRFHSLSQLFPELMSVELKRVGRYIKGLPQIMRNNVISSSPTTMQGAIDVATKLTYSLVSDGLLPPVGVGRDQSRRRDRPSRSRDSRKRGRSFDQSPQPIRSYPAVSVDDRDKRPRCDKCTGRHMLGAACWFCEKCKKKGHTERFCRVQSGACFHCGDKGHRRNRCPKLLTLSTHLPSGSGSGSGTGPDVAAGRVFTIGAAEARQDPRVVTGG